MSDFINNNSSAIFALITLTVTLLVPVFGKMIEFRFLINKDSLKDKSTFLKDLIFYLVQVDEESERILELFYLHFNGIHKTLDYEQINKEYTQLLDYYNKTRHASRITVHLNKKQQDLLEACISLQFSLIEIIEDLSSNATEDKLSEITRRVKLYRQQYFHFKRIVKKYVI
ncbi:hypothetical protein N7603_04990 [Acholeplasma vituli]|uniref:Uncharacterized protein n=1 Tax=Paracholeplasma vituli TaxID=69473 RepID=A0ABT2PZ59_9MOLU|nr:hypothetical protein [Paracholeplasma vituli]MCU0105007.1 hypothetical protein [Paracholeplasma vituli]